MENLKSRSGFKAEESGTGTRLFWPSNRSYQVSHPRASLVNTPTADTHTHTHTHTYACAHYSCSPKEKNRKRVAEDVLYARLHRNPLGRLDFCRLRFDSFRDSLPLPKDTRWTRVAFVSALSTLPFPRR